MTHPTARNPSTHHQASFVDRETILARFEDMLNENPLPGALWVHGESGTGKSMLVQQMVLRCHDAGAHPLFLEWRDTRRYGYLDVMRSLRDQTQEPRLFSLFNDRVNQLTKRDYEGVIRLDLGEIRDVQVMPDGEIRKSNVVVHVGHQVEIKDLQVNVVVSAEESDELTFRRELSESFVRCLEAAARLRPRVLFLDGIEKADAPTRDWVLGDLVDNAFSGHLEHVRVVIASQSEPPESDATRYFDFMPVLLLEPFAAEHIREYLARRGIELDDRAAEPLVGFIISNSNGNPLEVAKAVNNFLRWHTSARG